MYWIQSRFGRNSFLGKKPSRGVQKVVFYQPMADILAQLGPDFPGHQVSYIGVQMPLTVGQVGRRFLTGFWSDMNIVGGGQHQAGLLDTMQLIEAVIATP